MRIINMHYSQIIFDDLVLEMHINMSVWLRGKRMSIITLMDGGKSFPINTYTVYSITIMILDVCYTNRENLHPSQFS